METRIVLDLPDALKRRIEQLAIYSERPPANVVLYALEAACTPDPRMLQEMYTMCEKADHSGSAPQATEEDS